MDDFIIEAAPREVHTSGCSGCKYTWEHYGHWGTKTPEHSCEYELLKERVETLEESMKLMMSDREDMMKAYKQWKEG